MKIVFFGSDDFALRHLTHLYGSLHTVVACVTQPDRPKGRGMNMVLSPIKQFSIEKKIPCLQPSNMGERLFFNTLKGLEAEVFVVIAFGRILPKEILELPSVAPVNVHGSLLPKYRGAAPINWAIINGEKKTGLSIIAMNTRMDAGDILAQKEIVIDDNDTSITLREKMMVSGPEFLIETLDNIKSRLNNTVRQSEKDVTIAPKLSKELGKIDWTKSAQQIRNLIRGLLPWPGAFTSHKKKSLKILNAEVACGSSQGFNPAEIVKLGKQGIEIASGQGTVLLTEVQPESSKRMSAYQFIIGHSLKVGENFG